HVPHKYATTYTYNTLNQLIKQRTPDGGISEFWYDYLSRLVLSQDAKQKAEGTYSFTIYDALGRVSEVGKTDPPSVINPTILANSTTFRSWIYAGTVTELNRSYYDEQTYTTPLSSDPNQLRNRIAHVTYTETYNPSFPTRYDYATHYVYDIHGNVKSMLQDFK